MSGVLRTVRRLRGGGLIAGVLLAAAAGGFASNWLWHAPGMSAANPYEAGFLKAMNVGASATQANDSVIMCTGEVDVGIEALYILDVVTGELRGGVINIRNGQVNTAFTYSDVAKDLQSDAVKNPKYLMVTGELQTTQGFGGTNGRTGRSVVYVAETNSGMVACYAVPWNSARATAANVASYPFIPLTKFPFRQGSIVRPK